MQHTQFRFGFGVFSKVERINYHRKKRIGISSNQVHEKLLKGLLVC
jgi:hypothetical protein